MLIFVIFEVLFNWKHLLLLVLMRLSLVIGAFEYKLFVGSLNKQATVKEVEEVREYNSFQLLTHIDNLFLSPVFYVGWSIV